LYRPSLHYALPSSLAHHPDVAVVDQRDLDWETLDRTGHELLVRHLEATIAVDGPDLLIRSAGLGSHGRRHRVAHGAEATRVQPGARVLEVDELRRPHLVLADTGTVNRVGAILLGQGLDDVLRGHLLVRGVLIAAREVFLHLPQVLTPLGGIRTRKTVG